MVSSTKQGRKLFPGHGHDHRQCVKEALAAASALCEQRGERLTPLRRRVLELVWSSHQPIGAYALLDQLKTDGRSAAPPTVYRALDFLRGLGLVHRIESLNAFVGCPHPGGHHPVQFMICTRCGAAAEVEDRRVAEAIGRSAAARGFALEARVIELSGQCSNCRQARRGQGMQAHGG